MKRRYCCDVPFDASLVLYASSADAVAGGIAGAKVSDPVGEGGGERDARRVIRGDAQALPGIHSRSAERAIVAMEVVVP